MASEQKTVVLIHGAGLSAKIWPEVFHQILDARILKMDLPGHGQEKGVGFPSIDEYAEKLTPWITSHTKTKPILCGYSMGGAIALQLALLAPEHIKGLVLISSGAKLRAHPTLLKLLRYPVLYWLGLKKIRPLFLSEQTTENHLQKITQLLFRTRRQTLLNDFMACDSFDVISRLGEIKIPTLILCGSEDKMTPLKYSQFLHQHIRSSTLEIFGGNGHLLLLEEPETLIRKINEWMKHEYF